MLGHTVVPYFNAECFYDTRYDGCGEELYQVGPGVTVSRHFRFSLTWLDESRMISLTRVDPERIRRRGQGVLLTN